MHTVTADLVPTRVGGWGARPAPPRELDVEIVVPVYNEERALAASIHRLHRFLDTHMPFTWRITIADNASTDGTPEIARALADDLDRRARRAARREGPRSGAAGRRGRRAAARVVAYMDVDLSTDLHALLPLVAPLLSGHSDVAIGIATGAGIAGRRAARSASSSRAPTT